jgi:hypothetical protein
MPSQTNEKALEMAIKKALTGTCDVGDAGIFTRVACTGKGSELHVCGVNSAGKILHTLRYGNGSWQNFFGDISGQACRSGQFQDIACGLEGNDVHFCVIT